MKKGVSFFWGVLGDYKEKAKVLKDVGFDCVMTNADHRFNCENGTIKQQVKELDKSKLGKSSLHMHYSNHTLPYFWTKTLKGANIKRGLISDVKLASKYGFKCVVVHVKGIPSQIGLKRIQQVLKVRNKYNMDIAIENTENLACFKYIFDNITHKHLKFCYDIGHNNCFHPDFDVLYNYGDKLVCLHLHSNDGSCDAHALNQFGNINWDKFAKKLVELKFKGSLDYEVMNIPEGMSLQESAEAIYKQACELEQKIKDYSKTNPSKRKA